MQHVKSPRVAFGCKTGRKKYIYCSRYHYRPLPLSCYPAEVSGAQVNGMCQNQKTEEASAGDARRRKRARERRRQEKRLARILRGALSRDEAEDELSYFISDLGLAGGINNCTHDLNI